MIYLLTFFVTFVTVLSITPIFIRIARKFDFLDYPSAVKIHTHPLPLLGGMIVLIGFIVALFLGLVVPPSNSSALFEAINLILKDINHRSGFIVTAKDRVKCEFS